MKPKQPEGKCGETFEGLRNAMQLAADGQIVAYVCRTHEVRRRVFAVALAIADDNEWEVSRRGYESIVLPGCGGIHFYVLGQNVRGLSINVWVDPGRELLRIRAKQPKEGR